MSKSSTRFFCLGREAGEIFDANTNAVEHKIGYRDYITRAMSLNGEIVMEFSYRRDTLTFRIKTSASDANKWRWAFDTLFGGQNRRRPRSGILEPGQKDGRRGATEYLDSDEESFVGSLTSLASEVRLGLPKSKNGLDGGMYNVPTIYKIPNR